MIDWQSYGPIYTVAPGIKKIGDLPIIEFDDEEIVVTYSKNRERHKKDLLIKKRIIYF